LPRYINPDFSHGLNRERVDPFGRDAGADRLQTIAGDMAQETLRHLAAS
jgi:hypothetical protein